MRHGRARGKRAWITHAVEGANDQVGALSITCAGGGVSDPHP